MDWNPATFWWVAAGVLIAAELTSGTFYLLMLAVGATAGALAAHLGAGATGQVLAAAVVGGAAIIGWHLKRSRMPAAAPASSNPAVHLDIRQSVQADRCTTGG